MQEASQNLLGDRCFAIATFILSRQIRPRASFFVELRLTVRNIRDLLISNISAPVHGDGRRRGRVRDEDDLPNGRGYRRERNTLHGYNQHARGSATGVLRPAHGVHSVNCMAGGARRCALGRTRLRRRLMRSTFTAETPSGGSNAGQMAGEVNGRSGKRWARRAGMRWT
jgi:hypothetical protein